MEDTPAASAPHPTSVGGSIPTEAPATSCSRRWEELRADILQIHVATDVTMELARGFLAHLSLCQREVATLNNMKHNGDPETENQLERAKGLYTGLRLHADSLNMAMRTFDNFM